MHNVIIIDLSNVQFPRSIRMPDAQQIQAILDCEEYLVIDPLANTFLNEQGDWEIIKTGVISQENNIVMVR